VLIDKSANHTPLTFPERKDWKTMFEKTAETAPVETAPVGTALVDTRHAAAAAAAYRAPALHRAGSAVELVQGYSFMSGYDMCGHGIYEC
jgi:hypothetical protein